MKYPVYPKYKDSGVEWLGEIPEGWIVKSIKWISPVQRGASPRPIDDPKYFDIDGVYAWVRISDVTLSESGYLETTTEQLSELGASLSVKLEPGSLFISIAGTVGKPCITKIKACIHDGFVYFPVLQMNPKFLFRIFESGACYGGLGKFGTQLNLNTDTIGSIRIGVPPEVEIENILILLDSELAKIDGLIKDYEELVVLLQEKRQAIISHAVTRGLSELVCPDDPEFGEWAKPVIFKDSGVEWLGEIPDDWEVLALKYICTMQSGNFISAERINEVGSFPVMGGNGVRGFTTDYNTEGDFPLVGRQGALCGNVNWSTGKFWATEHAVVCYPKPYISVEWLYWLLLTMNLGQYNTSSAQPGLSVEVIHNVRAISLPTTEQSVISHFISREINKTDSLISETESAITLLKEHRSALITNVVTGKINVEALV